MKFLLCSVGGLAIGFGIIMLIAACIPALKASFDVSLFGLGVAVLSLGVILWDKAGFIKNRQKILPSTWLVRDKAKRTRYRDSRL